MSSIGGPNMINDELVFLFDAANSKSFRGEPTTNLANTSGGLIDWTIGNLVASVTLTTIQDGIRYRITSTTGGAFRIRFQLSKLVNGETYTMSYKYRVISGGPTFNATDWCDQSITRVTTDVGDYFYETATGSRSTYDSTYRFMDFTISDNTVVEIWDIQLEQKTYATPFTVSERGTTVSTGGGLFDLSRNGNNGTTTTGLTYSNTNYGTLSFDGSVDSVTIPYNSNTMDFSEAQTICMWLKPGTGADSLRRNPYNQAYGGSGTWTHEPNGTINYYFGTNGGNGNPYVGRNSVFTVEPNELAFIAVTRGQTQNECNWYKNGALENELNAGGYSAVTNSTSNIIIGDGYTNNFLGDIYYVAVYNTFKTSEDISQIYDSTKSRFNFN